MSIPTAETADPVVVEEVNPLAMTDEEFLNMVGPAEPTVEAAPVEKPVVAAEPDPAVVAPVEEKPAAADPTTDVVDLAKNAPADKAAEPAPVDPTGSGEAKADAPAEGEDPAVDPAAAPVEEKAPDYEGFFNKVMAPFKANGKTIELKDPEEAVQLMKMGANYTRKMQDLVPHRKTLTMLQNNNIDESKLSFLIDLDKKDPEAIKKLIKDSGIDPLQIDTESEPAYLPGNHQVTDEEVNFRTALEELSSNPDGQTTLRVINDHWDQASKDLLWKSPETLALIHGQRDFGIYDRITAEMDRQKTLGQLPQTTPFLQAYKIVGDQLTAAGAFKDLVEKHEGNAPSEPVTPPGQVESKPAPQAVATRVANPKPTVKNDAAANAAAPTRAAPATAQAFVNPLAMSDDEFLKQFNGRL